MWEQSRPVVIAGGSGFLGVSLAMHLSALGARVIILSRQAPAIATGKREPIGSAAGAFRHLPWDARTLGQWRVELDGAAALINLVGRSVDCIKSPDHQDEIVRSRVEATAVLGAAMRQVAHPPPVWVQMSTAHIYGDPPAVVCDEDSALGIGLAPVVGRAWEEAFGAAALPSQRKVILRTSFVIGRDRGAGGGALSRLKTLVRLGLGGTIGSGNQGMSWIHEADMNALFARAISDPAMRGIYIASSPNPVSQRQFMHELRRAMHVPIGLPAARWMVKLGAPLLMRTDPDLAIYGRYVVSRRLRDEGFAFRFPQLREALKDLL
ncbi:MAG TPA: DUF1731 domain-containing protein [Tepidisphaeraceae bacterium]|jgi:hypothetical protein|nr:DUF1731 domain-containing protein [Tepidisphaeraceae bacterium]